MSQQAIDNTTTAIPISDLIECSVPMALKDGRVIRVVQKPEILERYSIKKFAYTADKIYGWDYSKKIDDTTIYFLCGRERCIVGGVCGLDGTIWTSKDIADTEYISPYTYLMTLEDIKKLNKKINNLEF